MTILSLYTTAPKFPPTDQAPGAMRAQVGSYLVDYTGVLPTQAEVDAVLTPDPLLQDQAMLNAELTAPGSVVRALGLVVFAEINKLRVAGGSAAYTMPQFLNALKAQMR